jgi:hypothetical protein
MPRYLVLRDTIISHESRKVLADTEVTIEWPPGAEPKVLGDNLRLIVEDEPKRAAKSEKAGKALA